MPCSPLGLLVRTSLTLGGFAILGATAAGCSAPAGENIQDNAAASSASSVGATIASIAMGNVGLGACSRNSEGGSAFETSCTGNGGEPEYWCADFAQWVWQEAGVNTNGLDAAAGSFYVYGQNHGTLHSTPSLGDAVVFNYEGGGYADHVAIVVQVNSNGTIETLSGDWEGSGSSEAAFSSTSRVVLNAPAYAGVVGTRPAIIGMVLSGFVSPVGGSAGPAPTPSCIVSTTGESGTCIDIGTCAAQGGTSTPGYCPGAANVECCTGGGSSSVSTTTTPPTSGGSTASSTCTVSATGEQGTCIDTSDCAAQGGTSTPDFCPGAANIQCCTTSSGGGASATTTASAPSGGCYSDTLGKDVAENACVQSSSNGDWYQCANGSWVDRWDDPTPCNGTYPL
jgi:hypothetical protein